jgi:hypothetical protein
MNQSTFETLCERWGSVKEKQIRRDIATEIGVDASNLDTYLVTATLAEPSATDDLAVAQLANLD